MRRIKQWLSVYWMLVLMPTILVGVWVGVPRYIEWDCYTWVWKSYDFIAEHYYDKGAIDHVKLFNGALEGLERSARHKRKSFVAARVPAHATLEEAKDILRNEYHRAQWTFADGKSLAVDAADGMCIACGDAHTKIHWLFPLRDEDNHPVRMESTWYLRSPDNIAVFILGELDDFPGNVTEGAIAAQVKSYAAAGAKGIVLDLRNCPGGRARIADEILSCFLKNGMHLYTVRDPAGDTKQFAVGDGVSDLPVVVLVNKYSASAAELIADTLQRRHRAIVIGERTSGKVNVANEFLLDEHWFIFVGVTVGEILTTDGGLLNDLGVTPAVVVSSTSSLETAINKVQTLDPATDPQFKAALEKVGEFKK